VPGVLEHIGRTRVMGIVNVTPDSFSDGGRFLDAATATRHGVALLERGADLLDVGGESTRPGAGRVDPQEELRRVRPVVAALVAEGAVVSVDTTRGEVARACLDAGASVVNDVSAGQADPDVLIATAEAGAVYIAMHGRGPSASMQQRAVYDDVVVEVCQELQRRREAARAAGIADACLVLDPGLGFGKLPEHSRQLVRALPELVAMLDAPVLVGASRKGFLGALLPGPDGAPRPADERDAATAALTVLAAQAGAWAVRVHDVRPSADAVRVLAGLGPAGVAGAS